LHVDAEVSLVPVTERFRILRPKKYAADSSYSLHLILRFELDAKSRYPTPNSVLRQRYKLSPLFAASYSALFGVSSSLHLRLKIFLSIASPIYSGDKKLRTIFAKTLRRRCADGGKVRHDYAADIE
jgi:hypothetical protein